MTNLLKSGVVAALLLGGAQAALAANPMVGGAPMFEIRNIVENAVNSADHTTLVAAVQAADLVGIAGRAPARSPSSRRRTRPSPTCPKARSTRC